MVLELQTLAVWTEIWNRKQQRYVQTSLKFLGPLNGPVKNQFNQQRNCDTDNQTASRETEHKFPRFAWNPHRRRRRLDDADIGYPGRVQSFIDASLLQARLRVFVVGFLHFLLPLQLLDSRPYFRNQFC